MRSLKNLSRGGWILIGIVIALLLVPTGFAAAAVLKYTGVEGSNGSTSTLNKAGVTSAGQQLTTEAAPQSYREYSAEIASAGGYNGGADCERAGAVPVGDAFVIQQVEADIFVSDTPNPYSSPPGNFSNSQFYVMADSSSCSDGATITSGEAPDGEVGNVTIPLVPGYVVPSGGLLDIQGYGIAAAVYISGYLVPSADAPPTPQNSTHLKLHHPGHQTS